MKRSRMSSEEKDQRPNRLLVIVKRSWQQGGLVLVALAVERICDSLLSSNLSLWRTGIPGAQTGGDTSRQNYLVLAIWLLVILAAILAGPVWQRRLILAYTVLATLDLILAIFLLVATITYRPGQSAGSDLLGDSVLVWSINIVIFAIWYWMIDGGGPNARSTDSSKLDFLFSQETSDVEGWGHWRPTFIDYLYMAFSTGITFAPTDLVVYSHRGKILVMLQASSSLVILVVLAARAINVLT